MQWYALQVACQKEKVVTSALSQKGYECFLPLYSKRSVWSDRVKVLSAPLFPGYVFSRFDAQFRMPVVVTPNVRAIVGNGKVPPDPNPWLPASNHEPLECSTPSFKVTSAATVDGS